MKTKTFYLISVILILRMIASPEAISQNATVSGPGDEYWDVQIGSPGMNHDVMCLLTHDGLLYAGGEFTTAGGNNINRIAKWDGTSWTGVGPGFDENVVVSIAFFKDELYAGGFFYHSNDQTMKHFAKWNGSEWVQPGSEIDYTVACMAATDDLLYLGGSFKVTNGIELNGIAAWDGSEFHSLAGGFWRPYSEQPGVSDIKIMGNDVYAGGRFAKAGGVDAANIAKWDGTSWSSLDGGITCEKCYVKALAVIGNDLYVAGNFSEAGGVAANNIAKWDGAHWSPLGSGINGIVFELATDGNKLYAGGAFSNAGGVSANNIAVWDGNKWSSLGSGTNGPVGALYSDGNILYVGGRFTKAGNKTAYHIAIWNPALSIDDHNPESDRPMLTIRPNPASVSATIQYEVKKAGRYRMEITDVYGCTVKTPVDKMHRPGKQQITLETTGWHPGIYFVTLTGSNVSVTKKLMIQR